MKAKLVPTALILGLVTTGSASIIIYEPFDYSPTGDRLTNYTQNATGLTGGWSDSGTNVADGSLSYGSLPTAGNKARTDDDTAWSGFGSALDGHMDDGDTLWISFLTIQVLNGSNPDFGFALGTDQSNDVNNIPLLNSGNGLGVRIKANQIRAAAWTGGVVDQQAGAGFAVGTTYLIVAEIIFGATDTVNLYLPDGDLNLGEVRSTTTAAFDQSTFDTLTFVNKNTTDPGDEIDEIRIGTTYEDVIGAGAVPEVSSAILGGLGCLLLLRRRRA